MRASLIAGETRYGEEIRHAHRTLLSRVETEALSHSIQRPYYEAMVRVNNSDDAAETLMAWWLEESTQPDRDW